MHQGSNVTYSLPGVDDIPLVVRIRGSNLTQKNILEKLLGISQQLSVPYKPFIYLSDKTKLFSGGSCLWDGTHSRDVCKEEDVFWAMLGWSKDCTILVTPVVGWGSGYLQVKYKVIFAELHDDVINGKLRNKSSIELVTE